LKFRNISSAYMRLLISVSQDIFLHVIMMSAEVVQQEIQSWQSWKN